MLEQRDTNRAAQPRSTEPEPHRVGVLVVDDHPVVRFGVRSLLEAESDLEVVGEARSCQEGCHRTAELEPDVIILDLEMGDCSGAEALRKIRELRPQVRVIVYSAYGSGQRVVDVVRAGIEGYVRKDAPSHHLVEAVRAVWHGRIYLDPAVAVLLMGELGPGNGQSGTAEESLSAREREVLELVAQGMPNKSIARTLSITERTVKFHVSAALRKLGARNRTEAVRLATEEGMLERQPSTGRRESQHDLAPTMSPCAPTPHSA
jgi:DNA-binding NarL/FixJ family response regulator